MLKAFVKTLEEVAEKYRDLYVETDGGFVLKVEDKDYKAKLDEFRQNNIDLKKKRDELEGTMKRFEGIDPDKWEEAKKALDTITNLEEKDLLKGGKLDEVIQRRLATAQAAFEKKENDYKKRVQALETETGDYKGKYSGLLVETKVGGVISNVGVPRKGALGDIMNRARSTWKVNDKGELEAPGQYNASGKPVTLEEWAQQLLADAPYLFESQQGGSASGGSQKAKQDTGSKVQVDGNDPEAFGRNLEAIAKGQAVVSRG
jgi:hypothetical protein